MSAPLDRLLLRLLEKVSCVERWCLPEVEVLGLFWTLCWAQLLLQTVIGKILDFFGEVDVDADVVVNVVVDVFLEVRVMSLVSACLISQHCQRWCPQLCLTVCFVIGPCHQHTLCSTKSLDTLYPSTSHVFVVV